MTKLTIIGAGSSYTPLLIDHIFSSSTDLEIDEISLMDIDAERLNIIYKFLQNLKERKKSKIHLVATQSMAEAIENAKIVIPQIRVGRMEARLKDELLGRKYGLVGQETTGIGGFAKAMRTIPVIRKVAETLESKGAKDSWIVNFTNPVGIVAESLFRFQKVPAIGICNGSLTVQKGIAEILNLPMEEIEIDYVGPNHFAWVVDVRHQSKSVFPEVLQKMIDTPQAANITAVKMAPAIIKSGRVIPTGYHKYFFHEHAVVEESKKNTPRAQKVMVTEEKLFKAYANSETKEIPEDVKERGGAYYNVVAMDVITCLLGFAQKRVTVVVPNENYISGFEKLHAIEMPCMLSKTGPVRIGPKHLPAMARGLSQQIKGYEELAAEAGWKGDRDLAYQALLLNPLLPDADVTLKILDDVLETYREFLPQFWRT